MGPQAGNTTEPAAGLLWMGLWSWGAKGHEKPRAAAPFILSPIHPKIRAVQGWKTEATLRGGGAGGKGPDPWQAWRRGHGVPALEGSYMEAATSTHKCFESPRALRPLTLEAAKHQGTGQGRGPLPTWPPGRRPGRGRGQVYACVCASAHACAFTRALGARVCTRRHTFVVCVCAGVQVLSVSVCSQAHTCR